MYLAGIINQDGQVDGSMSRLSDRIRPYQRTFSYVLNDGEPLISVTQNDVRAIQLAKAALYAGARLLMDRLGIASVDKIRLAGAFGSHIDVKYAMVLGLIPDCRARQGAIGRQCGGHRRAHRARQHGGARRYRAGGAQHRKGRNRRRAHVPAALRRGHGDPAQDGDVSQLAKIVRLPARKSVETANADGGERRRRRRG
jgi:hypothetical protein